MLKKSGDRSQHVLAALGQLSILLGLHVSCPFSSPHLIALKVMNARWLHSFQTSHFASASVPHNCVHRNIVGSPDSHFGLLWWHFGPPRWVEPLLSGPRKCQPAPPVLDIAIAVWSFSIKSIRRKQVEETCHPTVGGSTNISKIGCRPMFGSLHVKTRCRVCYMSPLNITKTGGKTKTSLVKDLTMMFNTHQTKQT